MNKIIPNDNISYGGIKNPAGQRNLRTAWLDFDPALNTPSDLTSYRGSFQPK